MTEHTYMPTTIDFTGYLDFKNLKILISQLVPPSAQVVMQNISHYV